MIVYCAACPNFKTRALVRDVKPPGTTASAEYAQGIFEKGFQPFIGDTFLNLIAIPGDETARRLTKRCLTLLACERGLLPAHQSMNRKICPASV
mgnify:FL=1